MVRFFHPLLVWIANCAQYDLAQQVQFLKTENEILRGKLPDRISLTPAERERLIKFGKPLGKQIKDWISIVKSETFFRWLRDAISSNGKKKVSSNRKPGRPKTPEEIRELVLTIRRETGMDYTRILGELPKLGIQKITRQTVKNILKEHGYDTGPKSGEGTWKQFLKMHAETLWACDFLSVRTRTISGVIDLYLLVFIHVESRRVWVSSSTAHPNSDWTAQQARNFLMEADELANSPTVLLRGRDSKYTQQFDETFRSEGADVRPIPYRSPNLNAHRERWLQSLRQECLNHFVILGQQHLNYLVREYVEYYHRQRSHSSLNHLPPVWDDEQEESDTISMEDVIIKERLGGLLKSFEREAARGKWKSWISQPFAAEDLRSCKNRL